MTETSTPQEETRTLGPAEPRMQPESPKTPNKSSDRIKKDDSFKTCKTTMATPRTRRQLRMTPARTSILSGGNPFKEAQGSGKKFNSSRKRITSAKKTNGNDTAGSNETFIKCEQELMFDRDSLDVAHHKLSSTPKSSLGGQAEGRKSMPETAEPTVEHVSMRSRRQASPRKSNGRLSSPSKLSSKEGRISSPRLRRLLESRQKQLHEQKQQKQLQQQPQKPSREQQVAANNKPSPTTAATLANAEANKASRRQKVRNSIINRLAQPIRRGEGAIASDRKPDKKDTTRELSRAKMPPPPVPRAKPAQKSENNHQYSTPKTSNVFRKPASLIGTASRYLSQLNSTRLTRTQSFKSTAELERDYINSLRSFR